MYHQVLTFRNSTFCPHSVFTCFEWISEQTAIISLDSIKLTALIRHTVQPFTESDDTTCCDNTICPPEDGDVNARNMSRIVM